MAGTVVDITKRKRAEEALRESEARYRTVVESIPQKLFVKDRNSVYLSVNERYAADIGHSPGDLVGKDDYALHPKELADKYRADDQEVITSGNVKETEERYVAEGHEVWVHTIKAPIRDESGRVIALLGLFWDITDRKRAEAEMAKAKEAAEAANRAKSQFLANMSHEIRTPMTAILGFSDLLMAPNLSQRDQQEFLQGIHRNGQALLELINDILDISKIEAGKLAMESGRCTIQQVLEDTLTIVKVRAEQKGLSLDIEYDEPPPKTITTDPIRLRQILVNLVGNAIKFTEQGSVRIAVRCQTLQALCAQLQFVISDTGIGIPGEKLADLFQAFTQTDSSLTRRYGGAGLGLVISKRLAQALGGDIEVISQVGKGSTFTLTVAVELPKDEALPKSLKKPAGKSARAQDHVEQSPVQARILLVEDVPDVRKVICAVLDRFGLKTDVAEDGRTACEMALKSLTQGNPYDLILMDIQMPIMDGCEATRRLRQQGWRRPIVALTAYAMLGDREKCLDAGCDDYLAKPINITELQKILERYLDQGKIAAEFSGESEGKPLGILNSGVLDPAVVAKLMREFREELPGRAELIGKAFDDKDRTRLMHLTHQLKGAAGIHGLKRISETARLVHQLAQEDVALEELQATIFELEEMCRQAAAEQPRSSMERRTESRTKKSASQQGKSSRRKRDQDR